MSDVDLISRLERMEGLLKALVERETVKEWYTTEEFGRMIGKAEFTVREHCRLGRLSAVKRSNKRGKFSGWSISHEELQRYRRDGLRPDVAISRTRTG